MRGSSVGRIGMVALAAFVLSAAWAPVRAAEARSPGCAAWDALGVGGWTPSMFTVPGPFSKGEILHYTIDANSSGDAFYLLTTGQEFLFTTTSTGAKTFVLPKDVSEIEFNGTGSPPAHWLLSRFSCDPVGTQPPTDTNAPSSGQTGNRDIGGYLIVLAVIAVLMLVIGGRRSRHE